MKKNIRLFTGLIIFILYNSLFAQVSVNPQDDFYNYVQSWQSRGIVKSVPPLRPYALNDIKKIIVSVLENGNEKDQEIAQYYLNHIEEKNWYLNGKADLFYKKGQKEGRPIEIVTDGKVVGDISFKDDLISFGYDAGFNLRTIERLEEIHPLFENYDEDSRFDPANLGPIKAFLDVNNNITLSKDGFILQAGINRIGYGDFINEGLALNDSSYHMPNLSISYYNDIFSYTQTMTVIGATTNTNFDRSVYPSKFLAFHAIEVKPVSKLSVSFYENVVFGKRFDFSYLIPTTYMVTQGMSGYNDSIMMGTRLSYSPVNSILIATDLLVDDLSVNDLAKLNLDSKNRIGWTTGVKYMPGNIINNISLNYTMITPYTYAHWDLDNYYDNSMNPGTVNYQNYTNSGYTIGSSYAPNSDVIKLSAALNPVSKMKVGFDLSFMRHGNICESYSDEEVLGYLLSDENVFSTDGSIYTQQYGKVLDQEKIEKDHRLNDYLDTAWNHLNFLTQPDKMYVTTSKLFCEYEVYSRNTFTIKVNCSYCLEYIFNKGVDSNMYTGGNVDYDAETGVYTYNGKSTDDGAEVIEYYKNQWRSNLHNELNHYLNVGFTLSF